MKAAICYEFGKPLVVEEIEVDPPRAGEVKVRLAATAICHSDIHHIRGDLGGALPEVAGHESAGYVEEVGPGVTSVKPGDHVVISLLAACGECLYCRTGRRHLCEFKWPIMQESRLRNKKGQRLVQMVRVGSFSEYTVVHQSQVVAIPRDLRMDVACLLACGVITGFGAVVNTAKLKAMSSAVIIGLGGVGLNAVQGAAFSGAHPIIAVDVLDSKLEAGKKFGATHTINAKQADPIKAVQGLTEGRGADYVFVTVGNVAAMRQGFLMSAPRGTTVIVGLPPGNADVSVPAFSFIRREQILTGSIMGSTNLAVDVPWLIGLYRSGRLKLDELVTGRYPLERINEAIESTETGQALRNVIVF